jgi:uncharacterized membrane protein
MSGAMSSVPQHAFMAWCSVKKTQEQRFKPERRILDNVLYVIVESPPNIVSVIKSRRMILAVHVARMGREEVFTEFWLGGPKGRATTGKT